MVRGLTICEGKKAALCATVTLKVAKFDLTQKCAAKMNTQRNMQLMVYFSEACKLKTSNSKCNWYSMLLKPQS